MNTEEEKRLALVVESAVVRALQIFISEGASDTLGQQTETDAVKVTAQYDEKLGLLGEQGLSDWSVSAELQESLDKLETETEQVAAAAEEMASAASTPAVPAAPPLPPPPPPATIESMQQQANALNNMHGFPPKACPRCGNAIQYQDIMNGYYCPDHGVNPKPSLLQRLTGGVQELSTAAVATTGAVAGAGMGVMGASMAAQGQMAQMQGQMSTGPPPMLPAVGGVACPTCSQPAQDMTPYGGDYVGKYYCAACKDWVEPPTPAAVGPTVA